jgi:hypothetical protein
MLTYADVCSRLMQEAEVQMSNMLQNAQLEKQRQEALLQAQLAKKRAKREADLKRYSVYLRYWYKSINTDT